KKLLLSLRWIETLKNKFLRIVGKNRKLGFFPINQVILKRYKYWKKISEPSRAPPLLIFFVQGRTSVLSCYLIKRRLYH
ncbi:MAG: hypothetical protein K8S18_03980, partial [Desulfobacula sp.]|nr:hypothetical protein [Desulfobacula sp.]